jgi:DNA-binding transcriptional LysR family regulator
MDFFERCVGILDDLDQAELAVRSAQSEAAGTLKLTLPMSFGVQEVAPLLPAFLQAHPQLVIDVDFSDRFVDLVREGFDLAIRAGRLSDSSLVARRLASFSMVLVASPDYLARHGEPLRPADLGDHECFLYRQPDLVDRVALDDGAGGEVVVRIEGRLIANNGDALVEAARAGMGIALAPSWMVLDDLRAGRLQALQLEPRAPSAVWAVYPQRKFVPPKVRLLVDHLASAWHDPPWAAR